MGEIYQVDFEKVTKPRRKKSSPKSLGMGEYLKYGTELAKALGVMAEHGGLICSMGLCDKDGDFATEKALKFLCVCAVFVLGVGFVKGWWSNEKEAA